jgi:hemerythrin superfamily protein
MKTIKLEVEDSKLDIVLNIIKNLKEDIVSKCEVVNNTIENKEYHRMSEKTLAKLWDNEEDSVYDRYL